MKVYKVTYEKPHKNIFNKDLDRWETTYKTVTDKIKAETFSEVRQKVRKIKNVKNIKVEMLWH